MSDSLDLSGLPDLPQRRFLEELAADLWADPNVVALWLGGSLARGVGDAWSDVDLRIALRPDTFDPATLPKSAARIVQNEAARQVISFGTDAVLHHTLLTDGQIYDLFLQTTEREPGTEARLVLACRDAIFGAKLADGVDPPVHFTPADPEMIYRLLVSFWMGQVKHIRILSRGLVMGAWFGENLMRQDMVRLWFIRATGKDGGPINRMTIHLLTPVMTAVRAYYGEEALNLIGQPTRTSEELTASTKRLQDEVAQIGRELAAQGGFDYPEKAEETARRAWERFLEGQRV